MATDPIGPFPLSTYWDNVPMGGHGTCMPPMPRGAKDKAFESRVVTVSENGFDPGAYTRSGALVVPRGSRRGEDLPCGEISCGVADVLVPSTEKVLRVDRFASEALAAPVWYADPYTAIGWCDFTDVTWNSVHGGHVRIAATLKNWSENRKRLLLLRVWVAV
jgi:hypothetical protein